MDWSKLKQYWPGAAIAVVLISLAAVFFGLQKSDSTVYYPDIAGMTNGTLLKENCLVIDAHAAKADIERWRERAHNIVDKAAQDMK